MHVSQGRASHIEFHDGKAISAEQKLSVCGAVGTQDLQLVLRRADIEQSRIKQLCMPQVGKNFQIIRSAL